MALQFPLATKPATGPAATPAAAGISRQGYVREYQASTARPAAASSASTTSSMTN